MSSFRQRRDIDDRLAPPTKRSDTVDLHVLEGFVVATPWGRRPIRIVDVNGSSGEPEIISYSFAEDRAVRYRVIVPPDLLLSHPAEVQALVSQWTSAGHPNGSDQPLTRQAVLTARQPGPPSPSGGPPAT
jgi:hypothetical protein